MQITQTLYVKSREQWRSWLEKNHAKEREIWLLYPKAHTGKYRIPYADAVEESLCFGWIDSITKRIDDNVYAQRFTPRRSKSNWSQPNMERMRKLIRQKKVSSSGIAAFENIHVLKKKFVISDDILSAMKESGAWKNFRKFPVDYQRIRIAYIESRRDGINGEFKKSLDYFIKKTKAGKKFGYGMK
jgi:uncharacterized protein YdeI (YjbR/CyaY-like superfamily)